MEHKSILFLIFLMAAVTYLTRVLHVFIPMDRMPAWFRNNIHLIPVAVISSIISSATFVHNGQINLSKSSGYIAAIAVTVLVYLVSKSSGGAVIVGLGAYMVIKFTVF